MTTQKKTRDRFRHERLVRKTLLSLPDIEGQIIPGAPDIDGQVVVGRFTQVTHELYTDLLTHFKFKLK